MNEDYLPLIEELQALADKAPDFHVRPLKNASNKWLVRSALQKYVRRGEVEKALNVAGYLFGQEPEYAWHSLQIIIVEDIGLGDPDLLAFGTVGTLKTVTKKVHTPGKLYAAMVARAASGQKTRSCCELSLGAEMAEQELKALVRSATTDALLDDLFGNDMPAGYVAAVELRRRCRKTDDGLLLAILTRMMQEAQNPMMARAAMMTFERFSDTMNLATWPLVKNLFGHGEIFETKKDDFPPEVEIMGITSAAYDMHVAAGKKAIKAFCTSLSKDKPLMKEFAAQTDDVVKALGSLIFILEGGQEDKRLWSNELSLLKDYQDRNFAVGYGVPEALYEPMLVLVRDNFDRLNEKRVWAHGI